MKATQTEQVIGYLRNARGPVSARELFVELQINSPRRILTEVRRTLPEGENLRDKDMPNGKDKPFKVYWIESE